MSLVVDFVLLGGTNSVLVIWGLIVYSVFCQILPRKTVNAFCTASLISQILIGSLKNPSFATKLYTSGLYASPLRQGKYSYEGRFYFYTDHWLILDLHLYPTVVKWRISCTL